MVDAQNEWSELNGLGKVVREVEYIADPNRKTIETAYYIGSVNNVKDFAIAVRHHWGVESMHWSLDVTFRDDHNQTKEKIAVQNLALVKRLVFNILKNAKKQFPKLSKNKLRIKAATNPDYRDVLIKSI